MNRTRVLFLCTHNSARSQMAEGFLRAMAGLGPGAQGSGEVADALGVKINSVGPVRASLIKKGMIYSPEHGNVAFTVPLFDEFMLRAIPKLN